MTLDYDPFEKLTEDDFKKSAAGSKLTLVCLADVEEEDIDWLWYGGIPYRTYVMLEGEPDVGKTVFWTDVAARISTGRNMPDGTPLKEPRNVIIVAPEDALNATIKPRLRAAGADMDRVFSLLLQRDEEGHLKPLSLPEDLKRIAELIRETQAGLIIFDPITAFQSERIASHTNASVRKMLTPLVDVLDQTKWAGLLVRHLNQSGELKAIYRGTGSNAFLEVARSGFAVAIHPDDIDLPKPQQRRVLAQTKGNLTKERLSLVFMVTEHPSVTNRQGEGIPRIEWKGAANLDADTILKGRDARKDSPQRDQAKTILNSLLEGDGGQVRADVAHKQARLAGISTRTMDRAADDLRLDKVGVRKEGEAVYDHWVWKRREKPAPVIPIRNYQQWADDQ